MTVKNDFKVRVFGDPPEPEAIQWIQDNTPRDAVFLTNWDDLYTVPTLAGRSVFLGYSPWASSAGYDIEPRIKTITQIYAAQDKTAACLLLAQNDIDYVMISASERNGSHFKLNEALFKNLVQARGSRPASQRRTHGVRRQAVLRLGRFRGAGLGGFGGRFSALVRPDDQRVEQVVPGEPKQHAAAVGQVGRCFPNQRIVAGGVADHRRQQVNR